MYRPHAIIAMLVSGLLYALPVPAQTTLYVDGNNGNDQGGANNCADANFPCQTISHAVDTSFGGDTIEIADATYTEVLDIPRSLTLQGESEGGTIIQAHAQPGQATSRVITIEGDYEITISNLTIRHGNDGAGGGLSNRGATLSIHNARFEWNSVGNLGGGMENFRGNVTITDTVFANNTSGLDGGGLWSREGSTTLTDVIFFANHADSDGGGVLSAAGDMTLTSATFMSNGADERGGGMAISGTGVVGADVTMLANVGFSSNWAGARGGGMWSNRADTTLIDVSFSGNSSSGEDAALDGGGGLFAGNSPRLTLTGVSFVRNGAVRGGAVRINGGEATLGNVRLIDNEALSHGGGLYVRDSEPSLANVLFYRNTAGNNGGGMFTWTDAVPVVVNTTFSGNSADNIGGGLRIGGGSTVLLFNTIIWGNTASNDSNEIHVNNNSIAVLNYGLYGNGTGDTGGGGVFQVDANSLTDDPLFRDPAGGDLRLESSSVAIDAGNPTTSSNLFPTDTNGDPIDLDDNPRFFGDEIDMGAYEWRPPGEIFNDGFEG